jgi:D-alanine--poly(phosphoribitol) ligase subunit 1
MEEIGMTLLELIQKWASKDPDRLAYISGDSLLTYGELEYQSNCLASWVAKTVQQTSSPVIVYGHMEPEMIIAFLACVKSGHAYIPVDVSIPVSRVQTIIEDSNASLILSPKFLPLSLTKMGLTTLDGDEFQYIIKTDEPTPVTNLSVKGEDNFYIIYTSGSTGRPKGVQITSNCVESFVSWAIEDFKLDNKRNVFLNQAPYSFDLSVMDLYPSLVMGGTLWAAHHDLIVSPRKLFEGLKTSQIAVWTSTPSFVEMCLSDPSFNSSLLPDLRRFLFCGEVLPKQTVKQLFERFPEALVFNSYGPTEATVAVTCLEITQQHLDDYDALPVGYCKPDSEIRIVDEDNNVLPDGEKGEIIIVGPSVSKGYLGNATLTNRSFFTEEGTRGYRTNDAGFLKDGLLFYKGRLDFQIKLNGYRMEIEEIEHHLREVSYVQHAVVIPVMKDGRYQSLMAYVVPGEHSFEKEYQLSSTIKKEISRTLPSYMIPKKWVFVSTIPMTKNGKVDRKALMEGIYT